MFTETKQEHLEKMLKVLNKSESGRPKKELLDFINHLKSIELNRVYESFKKAEIKEIDWVKMLNQIFTKPEQWKIEK